MTRICAILFGSTQRRGGSAKVQNEPQADFGLGRQQDCADWGFGAEAHTIPRFVPMDVGNFA